MYDNCHQALVGFDESSSIGYIGSLNETFKSFLRRNAKRVQSKINLIGDT